MIAVIDDMDLQGLIRSRTGLVLNNHQIDEMERIAESLCKSAELGSVHDLVRLLETLPAQDSLWRELIGKVTIGETYFFRNAAHFQALRTRVLPYLIMARRKTENKQLRIWSAGCATGEEPYSLAMLLHELIPDIETWTITILATDINTKFLEYAQKGVYSKRSFRNETPETIQAQWFTRQGEAYQIKRMIRDTVLFRQLNLISDHYPSPDTFTANLDLIMCRNVTIYFDDATTDRVITNFHQAVNDGGWLVVGHSEPRIDKYQAFETRNFEKAVFYQKSVSVVASVFPSVSTSSLPVNQRESSPKEPPKTERRLPKPAVTVPPQEPVVESQDDLWQRARQAADREDWMTALDLLKQMEQRDRMEARVHYLRAVIELEIGDQESAMSSLRQTLYCDPTYAMAHYSLGEIYKSKGKRKEAIRHWCLALESLADFPADYLLPPTEDLTVEMLDGLLDFRLNQAINRDQE